MNLLHKPESAPRCASKKLALRWGAWSLCAFALSLACQTTESPRPGNGSVSLNTSPPATGATGGSSQQGQGGMPAGLGGEEGDGDGDGDGDGNVVSKCGPLPESKESFSKKALLQAVGECSAHHACELSSAIDEVVELVEAYAADPTPQSLQKAQRGWQSAMDAWSRQVMFDFGPSAVSSVDQYHGRGLGQFVLAWPGYRRCDIERQVALRDYETNGFKRVVPGARGLHALEYLLFYQGTDTACTVGSSGQVAWEALSEKQKLAGKLDYAQAVAKDLKQSSEAIVQIWDPEGENFLEKLTTAEGYGSEQEALNVVAWSFWYFERQIKDFKIGARAGVSGAVDPETPYAQTEERNFENNVTAFRRLFQGCNEGQGLGFDDWLRAAGADELLADMLAALDVVEESSEEFPAFISASPAQFDELYWRGADPLPEPGMGVAAPLFQEQWSGDFGGVKQLSDLIKNEFAGSGSPLDIRVPQSAAGDND